MISFFLWRKRHKAQLAQGTPIPWEVAVTPRKRISSSDSVNNIAEPDIRRHQEEVDMRRLREQQTPFAGKQATPPPTGELSRDAMRRIREIQEINRLNRQLKLEQEMRGLESPSSSAQ